MAKKPVVKRITAEQRFITYNTTGEGKPSGADNHHWWRDQVLYWDNAAQKRFVKGPRRKQVMLVKSLSGQWAPEKINDNRYVTFMVPDLGVFSRFEGDMLDESELHGRMQYVMLCETREFVRTRIEPQSGKALHEAGATHWNGPDKLREKMVSLYQRYTAYSDLFQLNWRPLPPHYLDEFDEAVRIKIANWLDPSALKKRERAHARKVAKEALSLE